MFFLYPSQLENVKLLYKKPHHSKGIKRPEHSKLMSGSGNPMYGNLREDLQIKFKGEGNPMYGKSSWNKNKHWNKEIKDNISESMIEYFKINPKSKDKLSEIRKEYHRLHPDCQMGDLNPMKRPEVKNKQSKSMKEYNKLYPDIRRGNKNPMYGKPSLKLHMFSALDHLVKDKYCILFNNKLKEEVRKRDGYICQYCGKTQIEEGKKLCVHHIHYDKKNCYPDLICLCNGCNVKANIDKNKWENFYMNKLNERNLLFWTKNRNKENK